MWVRISMQRESTETRVIDYKEVQVTRGPAGATKDLADKIAECFSDDWEIDVERVALHEVPEEFQRK